MKIPIKTMLAGAALALAGQVTAADGKMLSIKHGCIACHKVEGKMVGPAYRDVAARYRDEQDAAERLKRSVIEGGVNNWGTVPMPPKGGRKDLDERDAEALVTWILSL